MATIVTIHGTFADGEEHGSDWWQKGSDFERDVRTFVEGEDGNLEFRPFIWKPSSNSEERRRAAATELLNELQRAVEPGRYVVVAHSHGGSIAALATRESARTGTDLPGLSTLITVATPFLSWRKRGLLLSRLERMQQVIYIVLALYGALAMLIMTAQLLASKIDWPYILFTAITLPVPVAFHFFVARQDRRRNAIYAFPSQAIAEKRFGGRFLSLWHASDEAIGALKNITHARLLIFQPEFLLGGIVAAYMIFLPVLSFGILAFVGSKYCPEPVLKFCPDDVQSGLLKPFYDGFWFSHNYFGAYLPLADNALMIISMAYLFSLGTFFLLAFGALVVLSRIASTGTGIGATVLNDKVSRAVVEMMYGNDDKSLTAVACSPAPFDVASSGFLPAELQDLLSAHADSEAAKTVGKLRTVIGDVVANVGLDKGADILKKYLTWSELIHTSYFNVPMFRKLVCHAIAHSQGFRPSAALRADPDYEKLQQWLAAIRGGPTEKPHASAA